eukprot:4620066-Pyramimonas_sp.AAC.1
MPRLGSQRKRGSQEGVQGCGARALEARARWRYVEALALPLALLLRLTLSSSTRPPRANHLVLLASIP